MTKHLMRWTKKDKNWSANIGALSTKKCKELEVTIMEGKITFSGYKDEPETLGKNIDRGFLCSFPIEDWTEFKEFIDAELLRQTAQGLEDM